MEMLGWILSARNHTLRLERQLRELEADEEAHSFDEATRLERRGDRIRLAGPWGDEELELPFREFCTAAQEFLDWMRSQPALGSEDTFVVLADWLSGSITLEAAAWRMRTLFGAVAWTREMPTIETERRLSALAEEFAGPLGEPETAERLASMLANRIRVGQQDPRTGALAIARLAPLLGNRGTERAAAIRDFSQLARAVRDTQGHVSLVAELELRIVGAAIVLART